MNILNKGNSRIVISRGNFSMSITPGENILPDFPWMETLVNKHDDLEYILDVKYTDIGTIDDESKVINTEKAVASKEKKAKDD